MSSINVIARYAELHQGGRLARDLDGDFRPWKIDGEPVEGSGEPFVAAIEQHLEGAVPLGVYPLRSDDHVHWGAVDWDIGDEDSLIHAVNVHLVLEKIGIDSWVELSRSKGVHLWLYIEDWMPAGIVRTAMMAACQLVEAPVTEVYPKQISAEEGWGNGLRLPYARVRPEGRQVMVATGQHGELVPVPLEGFVYAAMQSRASTAQINELASRYVKPKPVEPIRESRMVRPHHSQDLKGLAAHIMANGPRSTHRDGKVIADRSSMLFTFACELFRQGYDDHSVEMWVAKCDQQWGGKFAGRKDGAQRIRELVGKARHNFQQPSLSFGK